MLYMVVAVIGNFLGALLQSRFIWKMLKILHGTDKASLRQLSLYAFYSMLLVSVPLLLPVVEQKIASSVGIYFTVTATFILLNGIIHSD